MSEVLSRIYKLIQEEDDLPYEEELLRNPYTLKCWLRYLDHKKRSKPEILYFIYERSLKELPGRYTDIFYKNIHGIFNLEKKTTCNRFSSL